MNAAMLRAGLDHTSPSVSRSRADVDRRQSYERSRQWMRSWSMSRERRTGRSRALSRSEEALYCSWSWASGPFSLTQSVSRARRQDQQPFDDYDED